MNGVLCINKPLGITSHDVVARVRRILGIRQVGHTGTLDPDAQGVLPVCVGKATRAAELLTASEKEYRTTVRFGITTDTQDISGNILSETPCTATEEEIRRAALSFVGETEQIPPMYSAIKQGGKKLYELARSGVEVERKARHITIYKMVIHSICENGMDFSVRVSKGTYIRTLCADIGDALGCGGVMTSLIRTACGDWFRLENAITLEELETRKEEGRLSEVLTPPDAFFAEYPPLSLNEVQSVRVKNGVPIYIKQPEGMTFRVYDDQGQFIALSHTVANDKGRICLALLKGFY